MSGNNRFRIKLTAVIFIFSMVPLIFLISFIFSGPREDRVKSYCDHYKNTANEYITLMDNTMEELWRNTAYIANIPELYQYLQGKRLSDMVDTLDFYEDLRRTCHAIYQTNPYYNILTIYAFDDSIFKGDIIRSIRDMGEQEKTYVMDHSSASYIFYLSDDGQRLKHYQVINSPSGILAVIESTTELSSLLNDLNYPHNLLSLLIYNTRNGHYTDIYTAEQVFPDERSKTHIILSHETVMGFSVYSCFPKEGLAEINRNIWLSASLLVLLSGVILLVAIKLVVKALTNRLYELVSNIQFQGERICLLDGLDGKTDEFGNLAKIFQQLIENLNRHLETENKLKHDYQKLELELLQAKINPHFLYNTLSAIKITSSDLSVEKIIDSLVHYYRITLSRGRDVISISKEVEMVQEYVKIQRFSYDMEFDFICEVDPSIHSCLIQKLTLQPFIENAILHGINGKSDGVISLTIRSSGDSVFISIQDNGQGMTPEQLQNLLDGSIQGQYSGYGIYNSCQRLKMFFHDQCDFQIKSAINAGTQITIRVPKIKESPSSSQQ